MAAPSIPIPIERGVVGIGGAAATVGAVPSEGDYWWGGLERGNWWWLLWVEIERRRRRRSGSEVLLGIIISVGVAGGEGEGDGLGHAHQHHHHVLVFLNSSRFGLVWFGEDAMQWNWKTTLKKKIDTKVAVLSVGDKFSVATPTDIKQ